MALVKFNNRPVSNSLFDELFNQFPGAWTNPWKDPSFHVPPVNIHETADAYHLELSAAGLNKDDFQLKVEDGLLTVSFEKKEDNKTEEYKTVRREFVHRSFKRSFHLDENVDVENIQARYENGVLKLHLPKREQNKPASKQISIQ
ncbi:MAG: Hsp20/alpha crystallin family protein [Candidatus Pseudobacter hemicellulosilyticus]|uniref:Hsp20/alpha crystallin family protein n=1 Tax=Candidatus Pseudobacter hemicellulosilyticus TaxID=3121375 RepID=A0AAJ6BED0_9BACT|nr:MAG: Hsp20/alpha crystallin family protein [Pseudobacter sp.]